MGAQEKTPGPVPARYRVRGAGSLGAALREFRYLRGWSQQDLADRIGVSGRYVWTLERAQATQQLDRLVAAFTAVGARIIIEEDPRTREGAEPPDTAPADAPRTRALPIPDAGLGEDR